MNDPLMDWANKSAKEQIAELLGRIAQMEKAALENFDKRQALIRRVAELKAEKERLQLLTGWQPIESAPRDGTNILLLNVKGNIASGLWQGTGIHQGWWLRGGNCPDTFFNGHHGPTNWMALPALPTSPRP